MTLLVVEELYTILYQDFTLDRDIPTKAIRPYLYLHNSPAGTFTLSLKEGATTLASKSYTMAQIEAAAGYTANEYHHGHITFEFTDYINLFRDTTYRIELSSSGYTFSEDEYIGWVRPHENLFNNSTSQADEYDNSFGYQLWGSRWAEY